MVSVKNTLHIYFKVDLSVHDLTSDTLSCDVCFVITLEQRQSLNWLANINVQLDQEDVT